MAVLQAAPLRWVPVAVIVISRALLPPPEIPGCPSPPSLAHPQPRPVAWPRSVFLPHSGTDTKSPPRGLSETPPDAPVSWQPQNQNKLLGKTIKEGEVESLPLRPQEAAPLLIPTAGLSSCRVGLVRVVSSQLKELPPQIASL